jgi:hypothetical protein
VHLARQAHLAGELAGGAGGRVVDAVAVEAQVEASAGADLHQGERGSASGLGDRRERREQGRTAADLVGLRRALGEQRHELVAVRLAEAHELLRRPVEVGGSAERGVALAEWVVDALEQQVVHGGEEQHRAPLVDRRQVDQPGDVGSLGDRVRDRRVERRGSPSGRREVPELVGGAALHGRRSSGR